jgi:hypothetical protein
MRIGIDIGIPPVGSGGGGGGLAVFRSADVALDFVSNQAIANAASLLTTTRAGTAYADDLSGAWTSFAANTARITNKGLLVEESRTNSIRNNAMIGAVPGTPGTMPTNWTTTTGAGLTRRVVGTGVENGIDYIDIQISGVASAGNFNIFFEPSASIIAAAPGQVWVPSIFLKLAGGGFTNVTAFNMSVGCYDSVPTFIGGPTPVVISPYPTGAALGSQRYSGALTTIGGTAWVTAQITIAVSAGPVDLTLRIGWPQIELGVFATSPIRTTAAAVVRAADVVTLTAPPAFGSAYTLYGAGAPEAGFTNVHKFVIDANIDGNNRAALFVHQTGMIANAAWVVAGVTPFAPAFTVWNANVPGKAAAAFAASSQAASFNGSNVITGAGATSFVPTIVNIGARQNGLNSYFNGYLTQVGIWANTRLTDGQLQTITIGGPLQAGIPPADIYLDFAANKAYFTAASRLATTRASLGRSDDSAGNWIQFANNVARITDKGLLVEEARTNSLANNSMAGAVPGTPGTPPNGWFISPAGGLSSQVVGIGVESGIDYIDIRFFGTSSGVASVVFLGGGNVAVASNGQVWTYSLFLRISGGDATGHTQTPYMQQLDAAQGALSNLLGPTSPAGTGALSGQRRQFSATTNNASVAFLRPIMNLNIPAGPVDVTYRIGWPQLELGSFATSPIRTTAAAVTRAADLVTLTTPPAFGSAVSLYAAGTANAPLNYGFAQGALTVSDGGSANRVQLLHTNNARGIYSGGVVAGLDAPVTWPQGAAGKMAIAGRVSDQALSFGGGAVVTAAVSPAPVGMTAVQIGSYWLGGNNFWNGYLTQAAIWANARLSNAQLQQLTA